MKNKTVKRARLLAALERDIRAGIHRCGYEALLVEMAYRYAGCPQIRLSDIADCYLRIAGEAAQGRAGRRRGRWAMAARKRRRRQGGVCRWRRTPVVNCSRQGSKIPAKTSDDFVPSVAKPVHL